MTNRITLDTRERYRVALRADVELRSLDRYLRTLEVMRPATLRRIEVALRDLGHSHLLRSARTEVAT